MSFLLYALGFVVIVTGLAGIATAVGIPQLYILSGVAVMLVVGILTAVTRARVEGAA